MKRYIKLLKIGLITLILTLSLNTLQASGGGPSGKPKGDFNVSGKIIDLLTYITFTGRDTDRKRLTQKNIRKGLPVGVLAESGEVYLIIGNQEPINKSVIKFACEKVIVNGTLVQKNEIKMITYASVEKDK